MDEWIQIRAEQEYRVADQSRRIDSLEEWKSKTELLPMLRDKVNFGLNALQFLYGHINAHVPEGRSQDGFSIRRSELLFWGKISETIPRWHILMEFQSINLTSNTPATGASTPTSSTFFRETYIDLRPVQSWAPNLNVIRLGIFRMPFGIFTETSGGLRDVISSPYLTSIGGGGGPGQNSNGTGGAIEFIQERDYFVDVRGKIANRLEYVVGIMNNNNYQANALVSTTSGLSGANQPKAFYTRVRLFGNDVSFISFTTIQGESNNAGTLINGRGKGAFDRYALDFRYTSKILPGFMIQGEYWQGHDGANATVVGTAANGACQSRRLAAGRVLQACNGARGMCWPNTSSPMAGSRISSRPLCMNNSTHVRICRMISIREPSLEYPITSRTSLLKYNRSFNLITNSGTIRGWARVRERRPLTRDQIRSPRTHSSSNFRSDLCNEQGQDSVALHVVKE